MDKQNPLPRVLLTDIPIEEHMRPTGLFIEMIAVGAGLPATFGMPTHVQVA